MMSWHRLADPPNTPDSVAHCAPVRPSMQLLPLRQHAPGHPAVAHVALGWNVPLFESHVAWVTWLLHPEAVQHAPKTSQVTEAQSPPL